MTQVKGEDKLKTSNMIKDINILKAREEGRQESEALDRDKEVESVMIVTTPPSKGVKSRKRKREVEELSSPSADAVSEKNLRQTAPMILARRKTAAYKSSSEPRRLAEVVKEIEVSISLATEEDFREGKLEKGFDEWTTMGSGCWQRMDLERASGYRQTSDQRPS